ncbi:MAG: thiol reductant ABC exporter subunit CydD, partial [Streptosporangiaceae bacterium]
MKPIDWRLVRRSGAARGYLITAVVLGLATTALIMAQASVLAGLLSGALGSAAAALAGPLVLLLMIVTARALAALGGEA